MIPPGTAGRGAGGPRLPAPIHPIVVAMCLGTAILGFGGRVAMHLVSRLSTGAGTFSLGGTLTGAFLGTVSGPGKDGGTKLLEIRRQAARGHRIALIGEAQFGNLVAN